jgi:hypothetical protein
MICPAAAGAGGGVTIKLAGALVTPAPEALTSHAPAVLPVAKPLSSTVATAASLVAQTKPTPDNSRSCWSKAFAVNFCVAPTPTVADRGAISIRATTGGGALTVMVARLLATTRPSSLAAEASTCAAPGARPTTRARASPLPAA